MFTRHTLGTALLLMLTDDLHVQADSAKAEPYFSGRGGVTSSTGWTAPIGDPTGYQADLVKNVDRIILSMIVRF